MTNVIKSLIWASIIIGAAYSADNLGLSDDAAFGITMALAATAAGTLRAKPCLKLGCGS